MALARSSAGTRFGTSAVLDGLPSALASANSGAAAWRVSGVTTPAAVSTARLPEMVNCTNWLAISRRRRSTASASSPPKRETLSSGMACARPISPTCSAELVSR